VTFKRPEDLSDEDLKAAVCMLLLRQQEFEFTLAEVTMLTLTAMDEVEEPTEGELRSVVKDLQDFLVRAHNHFQQINDTTDRLQADLHSRN
jgi:hypothetical protein